METKKVSVSEPIRTIADSPERVAFDLMELIYCMEGASDERKAKRTYFLALYGQCLAAVKRYNIFEE